VEKINVVTNAFCQESRHDPFASTSFAWDVAKAAVIANLANYYQTNLDANKLYQEIAGRYLNGQPYKQFKTPPLFGDRTDTSLTGIVKGVLIDKAEGKLTDYVKEKIIEKYPDIPEAELQKLLEKGVDLTNDAFEGAEATQEWTVFVTCNNSARSMHVNVNSETKVTIGDSTQSAWVLAAFYADYGYDASVEQSELSGVEPQCLCTK
jgi:hypothetical protein